MTKLIFLGCLSETKYKETCESAKKVISMIDSEYKVIENAPCCGSLLFHTASEEEIKNHAQSVSDWMKSNEVTDLVTICAGCYNYLVSEYPKYITDFNIKVQHIVQYINQKENLALLNLNYKGKKIVIAYHDPCHLKNASIEVIDEPRNLLKAIKGKIEVKELELNRKASVCCGAGGGVFSSFKENADANAWLIFEHARKARAKILITPCPFCYTALKKIKEEDDKIRTTLMKFEDFLMKIIEGAEEII